MMAELREAADIEPVNAERFYKAYERVKASSFYLSPAQIEEANTPRQRHWDRRMAEGGRIRLIEPPLGPDPDMNDDYLID